jgi:selenocysteine-specific elongation factor
MHVIATAGHVDHGKSALVRALTGMEPDRWAEEIRRGLTIDLGFAWTDIAGQLVAFVDVPGHERFVPNMLAGVGPVPAVLFVVAADGGWMPQSAEHLAAIDAMGISHGLLVVTRCDLADPGPVTRSALAHLARSSLGSVSAVAVSAVTGFGLPALRDALGALVAGLPLPDPAAPVRLWVDRSFTIKGSGTVVTGTLPAGTVRVGQELLLTPSMRPVRVRAIESLGTPAAQVSGVARVALNLRGIPATVPVRGMALVTPGDWTLTSVVDIRLGPAGPAGAAPAASGLAAAAGSAASRLAAVAGSAAPGPAVPGPAASGLAATAGSTAAAAPRRLPPEIAVHAGSVRTVARVRALGASGSLSFARLTLRDALPLHVGDRLLLRDPGAATPLILGATVLDVTPPPLRRRGAAAAAAGELSTWPVPPQASHLLRRRGLLTVSAMRAMGMPDLPAPVTGDWLADPLYWLDLRERLSALVVDHARQNPLAAGLQVEAARAALQLPDRALVEALVTASGPVVLTAGLLLGRMSKLPDHEPSLPPRVARAIETVLTDLSTAPFAAPEASKLTELGLDKRAIAAAARAGLVLRISDQIVLAPGADKAAADVLADLPQPFTTAQARQALGTTRRVAIPLLDYLDRARVTERLPDDRRRLR